MAPYSYPFKKLHRQDNPIRSLVNLKTTSSYKLAKYLDSHIKNKINMNTDTSIKEIYYLLFIFKKLIKLQSEYKMISIDIRNIYVHILLNTKK